MNYRLTVLFKDKDQFAVVLDEDQVSNLKKQLEEGKQWIDLTFESGQGAILKASDIKILQLKSETV